jgi:MoaA/NifB/PqqE/SkfB family radical SAM enzyme
VVLVGWGEPSLWPHLIDYIKAVGDLGMTSSIITNGSVAIEHCAKMRAAGLNHLHISVHGFGTILDDIAGIPGSGERQERLLNWLKAENWPWRMNMTVQQINYKHLTLIAEMCLYYGCRHIISLGFLPHYEWGDPSKRKEVAVHPAELRPWIEDVAATVENFNEYNRHGYKSMFTIRYHPMCHLAPEYRKYVVNARYVLYDPWEWEYGHAGKSDEAYWQAALDIGNTVSIEKEPCSSCGLRMHCGGWNKVYAAGFEGAGLQAVKMPKDTQVPGWLHEQNPANSAKGYF